MGTIWKGVITEVNVNEVIENLQFTFAGLKFATAETKGKEPLVLNTDVTVNTVEFDTKKRDILLYTSVGIIHIPVRQGVGKSYLNIEAVFESPRVVVTFNYRIGAGGKFVQRVFKNQK